MSEINRDNIDKILNTEVKNGKTEPKAKGQDNQCQLCIDSNHSLRDSRIPRTDS